jgi:hypothetical protein
VIVVRVGGKEREKERLNYRERSWREIRRVKSGRRINIERRDQKRVRSEWEIKREGYIDIKREKEREIAKEGEE